MKRLIFTAVFLNVFAFVSAASSPSLAHHGKGSHFVEPLTCQSILSDALLLGCDFSGTAICLAPDPIPELDPTPDTTCTSDDRLLPSFMLGLVVGAAPLPEPEVLIKATCGQGQLDAVISQAKVEAQAGRSVRVVLPPCIYREQLIISDVHSGSIEIVAAVPNTAVNSGADVFVGWTESNGVWSTDWLFDFGLHWPSKWPSSLPQDEVLKRVETFFVNGVRLAQVVSFDELTEGSFFIDEIQDLVFVKSQMDLTTALVEGTVRQVGISIDRAENIALRGLRVQHVASAIQGPSAVRITNASNILLEDVVVRDNSGVGFSIGTSQFITTRRVQYIDNGYNGSTAFKSKGLLSEDDSVVGSNWRGFPFGFVGWAVAGVKHLRVHDSIYRRLNATDNLARGFWLDFDIKNIVIDDNRWCDNSREGAFLEKIQGPLLIRGLTVCDNIRDGVLVSVAQNITIEDSQIENNGRSQILFSGQTSVNVTDWETGEQFILNTDSWTVTDSVLSAFGNQAILSGYLVPPNLVATGNVCQTDSPNAMDSLVCQ